MCLLVCFMGAFGFVDGIWIGIRAAVSLFGFANGGLLLLLFWLFSWVGCLHMFSFEFICWY